VANKEVQSVWLINNFNLLSPAAISMGVVLC